MNDLPVKQEIYVLLTSLTRYMLPSGCPEKAPGLLSYLLLHPFSVVTSKGTIQKNVTKCQTFNLTQCCLLWAFAIRLIIPVLQVEELRQKCLRAMGWAFIWHVCQALSHMQCPHLKPCPLTLLSSCPQLLPVYTTSTDI